MSTPGGEMPRCKLNELTKEEWWDIMRQAKPGLIESEFESKWAEFQNAKDRKSVQ